MNFDSRNKKTSIQQDVISLLSHAKDILNFIGEIFFIERNIKISTNFKKSNQSLDWESVEDFI